MAYRAVFLHVACGVMQAACGSVYMLLICMSSLERLFDQASDADYIHVLQNTTVMHRHPVVLERPKGGVLVTGNNACQQTTWFCSARHPFKRRDAKTIGPSSRLAKLMCGGLSSGRSKRKRRTGSSLRCCAGSIAVAVDVHQSLVEKEKYTPSGIIALASV